jgi:hypothetical protein
MAGEHPSESTLLAYVEDELDEAARADVGTHLAGCEACAADVRFARAGGDAAREAPLLEAPATLAARVREEVAPRPHPRRAAGRRWLGVVAPVAAALAIAGGIATIAVMGSGGGDDEGAGEGAAVAEESAGDTGGATGGEAVPKDASPGATLYRVAGDPEELARELRRAGFAARVEGSAVIVTTDRAAKLRRALADYPRGAVRVQVE